MSTLPIVLMLLSAFLHAGWNTLGKRHNGAGAAFFLASGCAASLILLPYIIWYLGQTDLFGISPLFCKLAVNTLLQ